MTYYEEAGKGDYRRKRDKDVSAESFESNWDRIFSKKAEEHCKACHGEGKVFDGGFFYDCTLCKDK